MPPERLYRKASFCCTADSDEDKYAMIQEGGQWPKCKIFLGK